VGILPEVVSSALKAAPADCVVSDVGSTKRMVVRSTTDERFVGGHPLAGAETAGVEHARQDLFDGAIWYLTPTRNTAGVFYERLHRLLSGIGAQPAAIEADTHDRLMASVSHLPHILANVLVAQAGRMVEEGEHVPAAGPSFRDATRVAGANDAIWTDIYLSNRDALMARIDDTVSRLHGVRAMLEAGDAVAVSRWNNSARADRDLLLGAGLAGGAVHELRVSVPNSPGVVAEIALALGRAGVNIVDMAFPVARA
jgi:prephenate dehydrogenase